MSAGEIAKLLRLAQRAHTEVCCDLANGSTISGTPHSVSHRTAWLITSVLPFEDVFIELADIRQMRPATPQAAPA